MCVTLLAVMASDLDIVAPLLAIRAFCALKLQIWACFDLRNVLLLFLFLLLLDSMVEMNSFFFLAVIWAFLWPFLGLDVSYRYIYICDSLAYIFFRVNLLESKVPFCAAGLWEELFLPHWCFCRKSSLCLAEDTCQEPSLVTLKQIARWLNSLAEMGL